MKQPVVHCKGCGEVLNLGRVGDHVNCRPEVAEAIKAEFEPKIKRLREVAQEGLKCAA